MRLAAGTTLGPYRIVALSGVGGMGEVYRAHDTRLDRDVAIKLIPEALAHDPERLARFEREARTLASLNHPHIAHLYGLEESDGASALVMEFVEGPTLAEAIRASGAASSQPGTPGHHAISLAGALEYARQIGLALDAAHEKGIVHRDLKPANVKLTPEGTIKVLDFGLAKLHLPPDAASPSDQALANSPTFTSPALATQAGMLLGTAAYMSPEQARGVPVDKRADIWAWGLILYEMLTGKSAFAGETVTDTLASVLRSDPDWDALPAATPDWVRRLLRRCLDRDPRHRLRDIGDAVAEIEASRGDLSAPAPGLALPAPAKGWKRAMPWAAGLLIGATMGAFSFMRSPSAPALDLAVKVDLGAVSFFTGVGSALALSPSGTHLAYLVTEPEAHQSLYLQALGQLEPRLLVEGQSNDAPYLPAFSPDGQWLAYVTASELRKVPAAGGGSLKVADVSRSRGVAWLDADRLVAALSPDEGLSLVPAGGAGAPQPLTDLDASRAEVTHRWPHPLPDGRTVLFTSHTELVNFDHARIEAVDVETRERKVIHTGGSFPLYMPSGHLIYVSGNTVFVAPFDLDRLELTGSPAALMQEVAGPSNQGSPHLTVSATGIMAYVRGATPLPTSPAVWVDRRGLVTPLLETPGTYGNPRLSPDGRTLSLTVLRDGNWDIWSYDIERRVMTRVTSSPATETEQVWSADGRSLVYAVQQNGQQTLAIRRADGTGPEEQIGLPGETMFPMAWSRDRGTLFALRMAGARGRHDAARFDLGSKQIETLAETDVDETFIALSPDERWLAYASSESGRLEVYVRSTTPGARRWQVSDSGGGSPRWTKGGREVVYRSSDGIMAASIEPERDGLRIGRPQQLFTGSFYGGLSGVNIGGNAFSDFDAAPDGSRFVMFPRSQAPDADAGARVTLITNAFERARLALGGK